MEDSCSWTIALTAHYHCKIYYKIFPCQRQANLACRKVCHHASELTGHLRPTSAEAAMTNLACIKVDKFYIMVNVFLNLVVTSYNY